MPFLKNIWYVGALENELSSDKPFARTILGEQVLFYRDAQGKAVALSNICPHRFAPLHKGRLEDGVIECPYHGLAFGSNGHCVRNPHGDGHIPSAMKVRSYPIVERYNAIWIWPGDAASADESKIPVFDALDPAHNFIAGHHIHVKANYQLIIDNGFDVSHLQFLHSNTLGSNKIAREDTECVQKGDTVWAYRSTYDEKVTFSGDMPIDRSFTVRWDPPSSFYVVYEESEVGDRSKVTTTAKSGLFSTPETETTTHFFFAFGVPKTMGEAGRQKPARMIEAILHPFCTEDMPMMEEQQRIIGDQDVMSLRPLLLPTDEPSMRTYRVMERLLAEEAGALSAQQTHLKVAV